MKKIVILAFVFVVAAFALSADVYVKIKTHTDAFSMMGQDQPAKDEIAEHWIAPGKLANLSAERSFIMDGANKMMYIINNTDKSYVAAPLPLDMSSIIPKEAAPMLAMMKMTVKVNPNGQTKQIGRWNCTGYDVDMNMMMMQMKMTVWASTDVPFDWRMFGEMYSNVSKMQFMDDASIAEFKKIQGYQIATDMTMNVMGANMKMTTLVEEMATKPAPAGVYAVPAGYTKKESLSLQDLQQK